MSNGSRTPNLDNADQATMLRNARQWLRRSKRLAGCPAWILVSQITGHGSTVSQQICREMGWDPDAKVSAKLPEGQRP